MTVKLIALSLPEHGKPKELELLRTIRVDRPVNTVIGWRILLRGPTVILVSSDGTAYEFARSACVIVWSGSVDPNDYAKLTNYTTDPLTAVIEEW